MLYIDYNNCKTKLYEAQKIYEAILSEKEELFIRTQPGAVCYDKDKVMSSGNNDAFTNYLEEKDKKKIDERLNEAENIMTNRFNLLKQKEEELRQSKNWLDIVYTYYYIDMLSIRKIEKKIPYSRTQIYRMLNSIKEGTKWD